MALEGKYIGLILAICSSLLIGISFVVTKKGLMNSSTKEHGKSLSLYTQNLYITDKQVHKRSCLRFTSIFEEPSVVDRPGCHGDGRNNELYWYYLIISEIRRELRLKPQNYKIRVYICSRHINNSSGCVKCDYRVCHNS